MTFLCITALRNITVARTDTFFHRSTINANGRLSQQRLLRSRHFATMVTWRHTSHLFWNLGTFLVVSSCTFNSSTSWACFWRSCPMAASWAAVSSSTLLFRAASSDSRLFLMSWAAVVVSIDSSSSVFRVSSSFRKKFDNTVRPQTSQTFKGWSMSIFSEQYQNTIKKGKGKCVDHLPNSRNLFLKEMHGDQFGELESRYWGSDSLPFSCGEMICYPNLWICEQNLMVLYHSNKTSLADLSHGTIYLSGFYKKKFKFLRDFVLFGHYKEWKETKRKNLESSLSVGTIKDGLVMTIVILQTKQRTARIKEQSVSKRATATTQGSL